MFVQIEEPETCGKCCMRVLKHNGKYIVCAAYANWIDDDSKPNDCPCKENEE